MMTTTTRQTAMLHQTIPTPTRRIPAVFDETNSAVNRQIAFDKMTATATRQFFSMPNGTIPAAIRSISRLIREIAQRFRFLALAAALAFPLLNSNATPLHDAARDGNLDEINRLIANGADVNAKDDGWIWTPLHPACKYGHEEVVKVLIEAGADVNAKSSTGWRPLHEAISRGHESIVADLLAAGADVNALLTAGADVNAKDDGGITPLHSSSDGGREPVVKALLAAGADVNAKNNDGQTPMNYAILGFYRDHDQARKEAFVNAMKALLAAGADVNDKDNNGWTPLLRLARNINGPVDPGLDYIAGMEFLLAAGADVNANSNTGWTPLHLAGRDFSTVRFLLAAGANVNTKNNSGWTPLHMAARYGHEESINALVAAGADVNAVNNNGELPLDIAIRHNLDGYNIRRILTLLTPKSVSLAEPEEPIVGALALTIERVGEERTEVRWQGGVLQFSPKADGRWRDVILDQGFFHLSPQD